MPAQKRSFFGGYGFDPGRAGDERAVIAEPAKSGPEPLQSVCYVARLLALRPVGNNLGQACIGFCAPSFCVFPGLDDEESAGGSERKAGVVLPRPYRREPVFQVEV